jgi:cysteine desulfurase
MAIGLKHGDAHGSIRFTLSKYTTKKELDYVVTKIKKSVKRLREISAV